MKQAERMWLCPWCGEVAHLPTRHMVICYSQTCQCGAVALGAPPWDTDEIIDDAVNIFGISDGYLTCFDSDRLAGLRKVGVEIREGARLSPENVGVVPIRILWFRRGTREVT